MATWAEGSHHGSCNNHWFFWFSSRTRKKRWFLSTFQNAILKNLISDQQDTQFEGHGIKVKGKKPSITKQKSQVWQLFFPDPVLKGKDVHWSQNHTPLHAGTWAKALLLLEMFPSSSQRSPEIRCSPALLVWLFYFSLQLYKCSAVKRGRACVWVTLQPGTAFGWDTAPLGFSLVAMAVEAIYTTLNHIERRDFRHIPQKFLAVWWMSSGCPEGGQWRLLYPREGGAGVICPAPPSVHLGGKKEAITKVQTIYQIKLLLNLTQIYKELLWPQIAFFN